MVGLRRLAFLPGEPVRQLLAWAEPEIVDGAVVADAFGANGFFLSGAPEGAFGKPAFLGGAPDLFDEPCFLLQEPSQKEAGTLDAAEGPAKSLVTA